MSPLAAAENLPNKDAGRGGDITSSGAGKFFGGEVAFSKARGSCASSTLSSYEKAELVFASFTAGGGGRASVPAGAGLGFGSGSV